MKTFKDIADKFVLKFGTCVMCVSLFSGCATGTPSRTAMSIDDLEYFQTDCKIAQQQIAMLHSMRRTADDQLFSLDGWSGRSKKINWLINWNIQSLRDYC
jgi:hypothetical protein